MSLRTGGYLIIEHTEALHVIDVNSGNKSNREENQETTALSVNVEAAREIARQLRLRDMGGIIVIDFIDMKSLDNKKLIYKVMKEAMMDDKAKSTVLPLSKFGLMQITRERVRPHDEYHYQGDVSNVQRNRKNHRFDPYIGPDREEH